jgi:hypothetical protein
VTTKENFHWVKALPVVERGKLGVVVGVAGHLRLVGDPLRAVIVVLVVFSVMRDILLLKKATYGQQSVNDHI